MSSLVSKVIIDKLRNEEGLEQDTIENVSWRMKKYISFSEDATMFSLKEKKKHFFAPEYMKKPPSKLLIISTDPFFSALPIDPNPATISIPILLKSPTAGLLYNDFASFILIHCVGKGMSDVKKFTATKIALI